MTASDLPGLPKLQRIKQWAQYCEKQVEATGVIANFPGELV
jgi:hypothetical protein